ncbi:MAG: motility associated factor glycosyltransferase family protein [Chlamydiales bacterium]|nr:motility associated factor glycosyltransferase family protein [Chlamydiales bacterium]
MEEYKETDVLCFFDAEMHPCVQLFSSWLEEKEERYLLFLNRGDLLSQFLAASHPKVRFLSLDADEELLKQQLQEFLFLRFSYHEAERDEAKEAFARIERCREEVNLIASDFKDMGKRVLSNYLENFSELGKAKRASGLFGEFKGVPAIICGAGPSLGREIEQLRKWKGRGVIFAGGSSLNVLSSFNLLPDLTACIDPDPPLERFLQQHAIEAPLFYQNRVSQELLAQAHGPRLWMPDSGNYPIESWMNAQVEIDEPPFDGGWNVSTFSLALARALGCSPIILVGVELSTDSERVYGAGVDEKVGSQFIEAEDVDGRRVYTKRDWQMAASWIQQFAEAHKDLRIVNATRGGLELKGVERSSLEELLKTHGQKMVDVEALVHAKVAQLPPACERDPQAVSLAVKESFLKCEKIVDDLLTLCEKIYPNLPSERGEGALLEVELEEEVAYQMFFEPLWRIWQPLFTRDADASPYLHKLIFIKRTCNAQREI